MAWDQVWRSSPASRWREEERRGRPSLERAVWSPLRPRDVSVSWPSLSSSLSRDTCYRKSDDWICCYLLTRVLSTPSSREMVSIWSWSDSCGSPSHQQRWYWHSEGLQREVVVMDQGPSCRIPEEWLLWNIVTKTVTTKRSRGHRAWSRPTVSYHCQRSAGTRI